MENLHSTLPTCPHVMVAAVVAHIVQGDDLEVGELLGKTKSRRDEDEE